MVPESICNFFRPEYVSLWEGPPVLPSFLCCSQLTRARARKLSGGSYFKVLNGIEYRFILPLPLLTMKFICLRLQKFEEGAEACDNEWHTVDARVVRTVLMLIVRE